MKFIDGVSKEKLRGGFYTPPQLVEECFARLSALLGTGRSLRILEPSAGDGAFVRGVSAALSRSFIQKPVFTCVELAGEEAKKCAEALRSSRVQGTVSHSSFFAWARGQASDFDAVMGNPPFLRYQFVSKSQRSDADWIFAQRGQEFDGVSNLWIPFLLISLELLREGGAFAFVLPSELFSTKSAGLVRSEVIRHFEHLRVDLYPRGSFARILQDVIVLSGKRSDIATSRLVPFLEHNPNGNRTWTHLVPDSKDSWTRYLLSEKELVAYDAARSLPEVHRLAEIASMGVSIVTGANDFFTLDDATVRKYDLQPWARPLLGKTNDSPGIVYRSSDHAKTLTGGRKAWILDFSAALPDPLAFRKPREYLRLGERQELPKRYKCRIREPWYRVPDVRSDYLMLSKRAHQFHRLILNKAQVHTTDTIYRGHLRPLFGQWKESIVAAFHNSLTILSAEIEGRTYGGGVLELVPSEIGRVVVPLVEMKKHLPALDRLCRDAGGQLDADDTLISATDEFLCQELPELSRLLPDLHAARNHLRQRRFFG